MCEWQGDLCELWSKEQVDIKPHSRLYHLEPIGTERPTVESLTSYITRLADAHSTYPLVLFHSEIQPLLKQSGSHMNENLKNTWKFSPAFNGLSATTARLVQVLEYCTSNVELSALTMVPWKHVFSSRKLLRRTKAWCPLCFEEWKRAGETIYEPLLWMIEVVTVCSKHAIPLQCLCPYPDCSRAAYPLTARSLPGFCPWCSRWLGYISQQKTTYGEEEWQWRQWASNQLENLLSSASSIGPFLHQDSIASSINACVAALTGRNVTEFARQLQLEQAEVQRWQTGTIPQLETLLWICACLKISLLQFFTAELGEITENKKPDREHIALFRKPRRKLSQFDQEKVKQTLETVLQSMENPPPSVYEIVRRLGCPRETLYQYFPEYCRIISQRYLKYRTERRNR